MIIKRVEKEEDCLICDEFLSKLNKYESNYDYILNGEFKFSEIHKRSLNNDYVYIAMAIEDKPIGYVFSYLKMGKGKVHTTNVIEVEALFVEEDYRKKGVGKTLIDSVDDWAKENFDDYVIELHAINNNSNSMDFYKHIGFNEVRTVFRR
jgi:GNAT superfamily N-acetyltransferase